MNWDDMPIQTRNRIWVLQDELDEINALERRLSRRYDRAPDGSREKHSAVESMSEISEQRFKVETKLNELLREVT